MVDQCDGWQNGRLGQSGVDFCGGVPVILRRVDYGTPLKAMAGFAVLVVAFFFLYPHLPYVLDWSIFAQLPAHWRDPFAVIGFSNPPWVMIFLPHALLPLSISMAVNAALNVVMLAIANRKFGGGLWGLVLILQSVTRKINSKPKVFRGNVPKPSTARRFLALL